MSPPEPPDPVLSSPEDAERAKKKNKNKKKKKKGDSQPNPTADEGAGTEADGSSPVGSVSSPDTEAALAAFDPSSPEDRPVTQSLRSASLLKAPS